MESITTTDSQLQQGPTVFLDIYFCFQDMRDQIHAKGMSLYMCASFQKTNFPTPHAIHICAVLNTARMYFHKFLEFYRKVLALYKRLVFSQLQEHFQLA